MWFSPKDLINNSVIVKVVTKLTNLTKNQKALTIRANLKDSLDAKIA